MKDQEHSEGCAQAVASYVLCSEVLTRSLGRAEGQQFAHKKIHP